MNFSRTTTSPEQRMIKDLVISVFIRLLLPLLAVIILARVLSPNHLIADAIDICANFLAMFYLYDKYPNLELWSAIDSKKVVKNTLAGSLVCLFVNFPHKIWAGTFKTIPHEYTLFVNYNLFEKGLFLFMLCLLVPVSEEILFRGFFYRIIKNRYNILWGTLVSTTIFTVFHGLAFSNLVYVAIPSLVFTYVYEKSGSIWASILTHSLNNTLWFVFVWLGIKSYAK